jgi:hypothetical protein
MTRLFGKDFFIDFDCSAIFSQLYVPSIGNLKIEKPAGRLSPRPGQHRLDREHQDLQVIKERPGVDVINAGL